MRVTLRKAGTAALVLLFLTASAPQASAADMNGATLGLAWAIKRLETRYGRGDTR